MGNNLELFHRCPPTSIPAYLSFLELLDVGPSQSCPLTFLICFSSLCFFPLFLGLFLSLSVTPSWGFFFFFLSCFFISRALLLCLDVSSVRAGPQLYINHHGTASTWPTICSRAGIFSKSIVNKLGGGEVWPHPWPWEEKSRMLWKDFHS